MPDLAAEGLSVDPSTMVHNGHDLAVSFQVVNRGSAPADAPPTLDISPTAPAAAPASEAESADMILLNRKIITVPFITRWR